MINMRGLMIMGGCVLALSACSFDKHSEVQALNEVQAVGSAFTQHLTAEYRAYTNNEMQEMLDYPDAIHFARKGLAAAAGELVMPEPVSDWNLSAQHIEELSTARGRIIVAFDMGARSIAPQQSAIVQSRFDCWIEQQEEDWSATPPCKALFMDAMNALEGMMPPPPPPEPEFMPPVEQVEAPEPSEPMKPEDAMYLVFFDFDQSVVGPGGANVLDAVAQEINGRNLNAVSIVGHTDSSGSNKYNDRLAMKRANAVRDALVKRGVNAAVLRVEGRGESELLVQTADDVREPANRRAQITFE